MTQNEFLVGIDLLRRAEHFCTFIAEIGSLEPLPGSKLPEALRW